MKLNIKDGKKLPLVSIIMNCYNGEKYLKQSIKSVIQQKYQNWEIIFLTTAQQIKVLLLLNLFKIKESKYKSNKYLKLYA